MRIGLDASSILPPRTGVGVYVRGLLSALPGLAPDDRFVLFLNSLRRPLEPDSFLDLPNVTVRRYRVPGALLMHAWRFLGAPAVERLIGPVDLFHSPSAHIPPQRRGARVATIHDLYFVKHPEHCHALGGKRLLATLPKRIKSLDRIIVPSRAVADDLAGRLEVEPERIRVIHEGVDRRRFRRIDDPEALRRARQAYGLPEEFILCVATLEPRKNLEGLLGAYGRLKEMLPGAPPLVVAGGRGWGAASVFAALDRSGLRRGRDVFFTGFVRDEDLPLIYNGARAFVLASYDEGFGLPLLEAMACGLPAATSTAPALLEVGGAATLSAPADDPGALAEKMCEILSEPARAESLSRASLERAAGFSWERCAKETLRVYREC
jgi:glycosyltransferase involved in cell wall biosynthesis